jgi:hypothetical protein
MDDFEHPIEARTVIDFDIEHYKTLKSFTYDRNNVQESTTEQRWVMVHQLTHNQSYLYALPKERNQITKDMIELCQGWINNHQRLIDNPPKTFLCTNIDGQGLICPLLAGDKCKVSFGYLSYAWQDNGIRPVPENQICDAPTDNGVNWLPNSKADRYGNGFSYYRRAFLRHLKHPLETSEKAQDAFFITRMGDSTHSV